MARRIDSLNPDENVNLKVHNSTFNEGYILKDMYFSRIEGFGDNRRAVFADQPGGPEAVSLYRHNGHWSIASDARKVSLI